MATDKEKLLKARELIVNKQFAEARAILRTLPANPTAQQWLTKLDQIDPESSVLKPLRSTPLTPEPPPPAQEPMDPNKIAMWRLWFAPVMMWKYSRNWARLGRPEWGWNTALGGLLILAWLVVGLVVLALNLRSVLALGLMISAAMANLAYWIIIGHLQNGAYKTWTTTHDWAALRAFRYRADITIAGVVVASVIGAIVLTGVLWYTTRPTGFENGDLSLTYDSGWKTRASDDVSICQDYDFGCFLVLTDKQFGYTTIAFVKTHITGGVQTSEDGDAYLWANYWGQVAGVELVSREDLLIDGLPAISREFSYPQSGDDPMYMMVIVLVNGRVRYDITVWALNQAIFEEDRNEIMDIITSIDFKSSGAAA